MTKRTDDRPRRRKGEGSLFQRKSDGLWVGRLRDPASGQTHSVYGRSYDEAADSLGTLRERLRHGLPPEPRRETVRSYLERWLADTASQSVRPSTLRRYALDVERLSLRLGQRRLVDLQPAEVQAFLNRLSALGLAPSSVRHCRTVLRAALRQAEREGLLTRNVAALTVPPRVPPRDPAAMTLAEAQAILVAFAGHEFEHLVTLALATGLRLGELLGLAWADVDLTAGTLLARQQVQRLERRSQLVPVKTRRSRRALQLPQVALAALRARRQQQREQKLKAGGAWVETGLVFTRLDGGLYNPSNVTRRFQHQLAKAGLPVIRFHDLRHGTATLLIAAGVPQRVVMEVLGHAQVSTTLNLYAHVAPDLQRGALDALDRALSGGSEGR